MRKYKVMLVDDESDVIDVIQKKIDWNALGLEEPVSAANGLEALEKAEADIPDIVMTDIKMPYMDGLELSRRLKENYPNIRIIIFSGFDEFEYAKEAVRLAAEEYILKPVNSEELTKVFLRIKEHLDQDLNEKRNKEMLEQYYEQSIPLLRENFFVSLIQGRIPGDQVGRYLRDAKLSFSKPYQTICVFHTSSSHVPEGMNYMLLCMSVRKLAEENISSDWEPHFFNYLGNTCMIASLDSEDDLRKLTDQMDIFCRLCKTVCQAVVTCGIGQACRSHEDLPASYNGARQAVSYRVIYGPVKAILITEAAPAENEETEDIGETELREVFRRIKLEDTERMFKTVDEYLDKNARHSSVQGYRLFVLDLVGELCRFARNNDLELRDIFGTDDPIYMDIQTKDREALAAWMKDICLRMQKKIQEKRNNTTHSFVEKAIDYVHEHYSNENLSVADVCSELGVSSAYFSTVFRKETGKTFINYLTEYRMQKAVELLIEHNEKTYVIANLVGYSDPNYFSYVFKKQFGVSPSKYKQQK